MVLKLLLDSHALLWAFQDSPRLPRAVRDVLVDAANLKMVSAASVWELEIKRATGKLTMPDDLVQGLSNRAYQTLAVTIEHAVHAARLPLHHRDPFDRMLVAQAQLEGLTIVTSDQTIGRYEVPVLWD